MRAYITFLLTFLLTLLLAGTATADSNPAGATLWRWIGTKADLTQPCPQARGNWLVEPLFPHRPMASSSLSAFCRYNFISNAPIQQSDIDQVTGLVPTALDRVGTDAMAIGANAWSDYSSNLWLPLESHFLAQAAQMPGGTMSGNSGARLAVIDSTPTADQAAHTVVGSSLHGYSLLNMAHQLLCSQTGGAACGVHLTSQLALTYLTYDPSNPAGSTQDLINGGYVGTISDLAQAIEREISAWQTDGQDPHLVLNLAVGWNPSFGGLEPDPAQMPPAARAVYEALQHAACEGVLALAAAGNRTGGPTPAAGPILPAAWNLHDAPDASVCQAITTTPLGKPLSDGRPLVYAVAGVVSDGATLSNARPLSEPLLAAYADHAVVEGHIDGQPTSMLTGSSVATLVASAAAAAAWQYLPDEPAGSIMNLLYEIGDDLNRPADFCWGTMPGEPCPWSVRRVSVCAAAAAACAVSGTACTPAACEPWIPEPPDLDASFQIINPDNRVDLATITEPYTDPSTCSPDLPLFDPFQGPSMDPCPDRQFISVEATPWVHPQPGSIPCPPCRLQNQTQTLVMEIDTAFEGTLSAATLTACNVSYSLGPLSLQAGDTTVIHNVDTGGCNEASVSFTVENNNTTSSATSPTMIVN